MLLGLLGWGCWGGEGRVSVLGLFLLVVVGWGFFCGFFVVVGWFGVFLGGVLVFCLVLFGWFLQVPVSS